MPERPPVDVNRLLLAAAIGLVLMLVAAALAAQPLAAGSPFDRNDALARSQAAIGRAVGDHGLVDATGKPIRLADFRGRPLIVTFVYTGCFDVCPTTTKFLAQAVADARRTVGDDAFAVLTIGFNLPFDAPPAMREYARRQGINDARWTFASALPESVAALTADFGFAYRPTAAGFDHVTQVTLVDATGRVATQIYGDSFELPMLVAPLRELVLGRPVARQDLSAWIDRVRLLCTVYDPASGRYRLNYGLFIELFAGLSMLGATIAYVVLGARRRRDAPRTITIPS